MTRLLALAVAGSAVLAACSSTPSAPVPTSTVERSATPTPTVPTATPTLAGAAASADADAVPRGAARGRVTQVVDGDTIDVLMNGQVERVRLILVDTPEVVDDVECFGREASAYLSGLIGRGTVVYLERDVSETDRYDRLLRYVYREDGAMVNELLVREGYATVATFPPDVKHYERIRAAEDEARAGALGLWGACADAAAVDLPGAVGPTPIATVATPTTTPSVAPTPPRALTVAPTATPTALATAIPPPPPAPSITAFCNAADGTTSDSCALAGASPLQANGGWSIWARNVGDWGTVLFRLNLGAQLSRNAFSATFASLSGGAYGLEIGELGDGRVVWSDPWVLFIAAPAQPTLAQQECARYTQAYNEAVAQGGAQIFLTFLFQKMTQWC